METKINFIENPNRFGKEKMEKIYGGISGHEAGLCFVFGSCKSKCKKNITENVESASQTTNKNERKTKLFKKYDKLFCFVVTMN